MSWTRQSVAVSVLATMDEHRKQAGIRAAALRDAKRWSQEELAHYANISSRRVSRFENGRRWCRAWPVSRWTSWSGR